MKTREHDRIKASLTVFVLICFALGCISAFIGSPGTSFGMLQGVSRPLWKVLRVSLLLLGTVSGALGGHVWGLLEPLWGLLRKTSIFTALRALP